MGDGGEDNFPRGPASDGELLQAVVDGQRSGTVVVKVCVHREWGASSHSEVFKLVSVRGSFRTLPRLALGGKTQRTVWGT